MFGYYIEVSKSYAGSVPLEYQRKQTLANSERYITPQLKEAEEKILSAKENCIQLEYRLFTEIRENFPIASARSSSIPPLLLNLMHSVRLPKLRLQTGMSVRALIPKAEFQSPTEGIPLLNRA